MIPEEGLNLAQAAHKITLHTESTPVKRGAFYS
jgi:hypothetical protein